MGIHVEHSIALPNEISINTTVDYKITDEYVDFRMAVFAPEAEAQL